MATKETEAQASMPESAQVRWGDANIQAHEIEIIRRQDWEEMIIHRSNADFIWRAAMVEIVLLLLLGVVLGIIYLLNLESNPLSRAAPSAIVVIVFMLINAGLLLLAYKRTKSSYFRLTPNLYKRQSDVLISIPGTIEKYRGIIFRHVEIYPVNEFERVSYNQSFFSRWFNGGNIELHRQKGTSVILPNAQDPVKYTAEIQKLLADISGMNPQQQYLVQAG